MTVVARDDAVEDVLKTIEPADEVVELKGARLVFRGLLLFGLDLDLLEKLAAEDAVVDREALLDAGVCAAQGLLLLLELDLFLLDLQLLVVDLVLLLG